MYIVTRASNGVPADSRHICLGQAEVLDVLGPAPKQIAFQTRQTSGNRLLISLAEAVPLDTAVQIVRDGALLLGEVTGCWQARNRLRRRGVQPILLARLNSEQVPSTVSWDSC